MKNELPQVFVDGNPAVVLRGQAEKSANRASKHRPAEPTDDARLPVTKN